MTFLDEIRLAGYCMFCVHHTHDFPDDDWHSERHAGGWHTCGIDGRFRQSKPLCKHFRLDEGVQAGS